MRNRSTDELAVTVSLNLTYFSYVGQADYSELGLYNLDLSGRKIPFLTWLGCVECATRL